MKSLHSLPPNVQREMVDGLRKEGCTDQEIIDALICNMWKGDRPRWQRNGALSLG
jgi:hypothetical protein